MNDSILIGKQVVLELLMKSPHKIEKVWIQKNRFKNVNEILKLCQNNKVKYQFVPKEKLDKLTQGKHQGFAVKVFLPGFIDEEKILSLLKQAKFPVILALDEIQDQGNIGSIARTLYSLGGTGLIFTKYRSAQLGIRAYKSSSGALTHLPIARTVNLKRFFQYCHEDNVWIYYGGTDKGAINLYEAEISFPAVLVLGNEEKGVKPSIRKMCHQGLKIPMLGEFDSLNVAQAAAIFMGEFLRRWLFICSENNFNF
jgi:23S rRNA (guanosine2251-2'-O)-methyltransferase